MGFLVERVKRFFIKKAIKKHNKIKHIVIETASITGVDNLKVGDGCRFSPGMKINAAGGLDIGNNVIFAPNVVIWTQNHNYRNATELPYDSVIHDRSVSIGSGSWIGEGVKIAPGVSIGKGVIVSMGSVVFGKIPDFSVVSGNPAKILRLRDDVDNFLALDETTNSYIANKIS